MFSNIRSLNFDLLLLTNISTLTPNTIFKCLHFEFTFLGRLLLVTFGLNWTDKQEKSFIHLSGWLDSNINETVSFSHNFLSFQRNERFPDCFSMGVCIQLLLFYILQSLSLSLSLFLFVLLSLKFKFITLIPKIHPIATFGDINRHSGRACSLIPSQTHTLFFSLSLSLSLTFPFQMIFLVLGLMVVVQSSWLNVVY